MLNACVQNSIHIEFEYLPYIRHRPSIASFLLPITVASQDELKPKQCIVRFKNNNSKRWDGKEVRLDSEILDELCDSTKLFHGANITVTWKCKGGRITH